MNKILTKLTIALAISLSTNMAIAQTKIEAGKYQIDPMHSKVGFEVPHLVVSSVEGMFKSFEGNIEISQDITKSKVVASVNIDSIDTGVGKRDEHLKSPDFFDSKKYPKMSFESRSITGSPESFTMEGDLIIKGQKKSVKFTGKYLGAVTDGYGNRKVALQASAQVNRKDFGLNWNSMVEAGPVVGDTVTIELKIQAAKQLAK